MAQLNKRFRRGALAVAEQQQNLNNKVGTRASGSAAAKNEALRVSPLVTAFVQTTYFIVYIT